MRRLLLAVLALALAACGPDATLQLHEDHYVDHDIGEWTAELNVGQAGGCDTSIVRGLTSQLFAEMNCIAPNTMVNFKGPNITITNPVEPYLAPAASAAMKRAVAASGTFITINSAWRSVAQQYLLYKWWKAGQCRIQVAATPGKSNHQSGRAIDIPSYSFWLNKLQAQGWRWLGNSDRVHFDYNGAADQSARSVLAFQKLWNKNNSSKLSEDGQWGPNTENAMKSSPATGFAKSGCGPVTPPPPPPTATGTIKGKIYKLNPANAADTSQAIAGATVKVGGKTLTTGADGMYEAALAQGTYTAAASATGYANASVSRMVTSGAVIWGSIGLAASGTADTVKPEIELSSPATGAKLDVAKVMLTGTASDDRSDVKTFTVKVNDAAATPVVLTDGAFETEVVLKPAANVVLFEAIDGAGNKASLTVNLTFRAGVEGLVTTGDAEAARPVENVAVSLETMAGEVKMSTTTAADGTYAFELTSVPTEPWMIVARAQGFAEYRSEIELSSEARTSWSFTLDTSNGEKGVRILSPSANEEISEPTISVVGVVDGFLPTTVSVNGQTAELGGQGRFTFTQPAQAGLNMIHVEASGPNGERASADVVVTRPFDETGAKGGCSAAPVPFVLGVALWVLRRRRSNR